jgi:fumarylacetoacetase
MTSWLGVGDDDPYGLGNLPYGCAAGPDGTPRAVVRIGAHALDLTAATRGTRHAPLFAGGTLDSLLAAGRATWTAVREQVVTWLADDAHRDRIEPCLQPVSGLRMVLPFTVADYVDFYASEHHATNVGRIFRPDGEPLTPNWKHLPIGYHGRAGTVVVSGTEIRRPCGQAREPGGQIRFGPSHRLDIEAELGFVVGRSSQLGQPVGISEFREHVFGVCLVNDWSARDIQAWEYVPLGPFLGKSFATSIAAWITPLDALARTWTALPPRQMATLPYLDHSADGSAAPCGLDVALEIRLNGTLISTPPYSGMYWSPAQMLAHMTVNGASLRPGDLYASGTISGAQRNQRGSLLELAWNGTEPITLDDGTTRAFLHDGDEVVITATAPGPHGRIGLAEVRGRITPAHGPGASV